MNNKSRLQRNSLSELPTSPLVAYQPSSDRENLTPTRDVTPFHRHPSQQVMVDGSLDGPTQPLPIPKNASQFMHKPGQRFSNGRRSRRIAVLWCCIGLFVLATALSSLSLYQNYSGQYHHDMTLARSGIQHLQTAETLIKNLARGAFDVHNVTQARQEFTAAFTVFSQLKNDLTQIPSAATLLPKYGTLVSAALHIVPLAVELSQAGMIGCDALTIIISRLSEPLNSGGHSITMEDLTTINQDVLQIQALLNTAADRINHLQPSDLQIDPRVGSAIAAFRVALPELQRSLQTSRTLLGIAPTLLGIKKPAFYLIEQLDSSELRPGGGFIGSYGIASVSGGRIESIHLTDTYLLDKSFETAGHSIPYPAAYKWFDLASGSWGLRDSNLDADFPTAAQYAERIYSTEGGTYPIQGVIAITPGFVENVLNITGPIYVNEYHETITAFNLIDLIHYHQLNQNENGGDTPSPDGHSSLRKRFTELLSEHLFARVRQLSPTEMPHLISLLLDSLHTKDIQVYLDSKTGEELLQSYQLASAIQAASGDSLSIVDANITPSKANRFITYTMQDQITIDSAGNAIHRTTFIYNWPFNKGDFQNSYGPKMYRDYVRIYTPAGSTLQMQNGWIMQGTSEAFGRRVWAGIFRLSYGQTGTISLVWTVHNAAIRYVNGWHYYYLIQRQAGIVWHLNLQVVLPSCAHNLSGLHNLSKTNEHGAQLNQPLTTNMQSGIDYIC